MTGQQSPYFAATPVRATTPRDPWTAPPNPPPPAAGQRKPLTGSTRCQLAAALLTVIVLVAVTEAHPDGLVPGTVIFAATALAALFGVRALVATAIRDQRVTTVFSCVVGIVLLLVVTLGCGAILSVTTGIVVLHFG